MEPRIVWSPVDYFCDLLFSLIEKSGRRPVFVQNQTYLVAFEKFKNQIRKMGYELNSNPIDGYENINDKCSIITIGCHKYLLPTSIEDSKKRVDDYLGIVSPEILIYFQNPDFIRNVIEDYDLKITAFISDVIQTMGYKTSPLTIAIPAKLKRNDTFFYKIHSGLTNQPTDVQTILSYLIDVITTSNGEIAEIVELLAKMHKNSLQIQDEIERNRQLAHVLGTKALSDLYPTK